MDGCSGTAELVEEHQGLESIHPRVAYLLLDLHRLPMAELREVDHPVA
ncbi:MAG: hypothetical protein GY856_51115, partial [bacterium]|nr:hypothetical protein [bacterium]